MKRERAMADNYDEDAFSVADDGLDPAMMVARHFARELRTLRKRAGMSQVALARAINYSPTLVSMIETCERLPGEDFCGLADKVLGTNGALSRLGELVRRMHWCSAPRVAGLAAQARDILAKIPKPRTGVGDTPIDRLRRRTPRPFALVAGAVDGDEWDAYAHGLVDGDGRVWTWPATGKVDEARRWDSVAAAASAHAAAIVWGEGGFDDPAGVYGSTASVN